MSGSFTFFSRDASLHYTNCAGSKVFPDLGLFSVVFSENIAHTVINEMINNVCCQIETTRVFKTFDNNQTNRDR